MNIVNIYDRNDVFICHGIFIDETTLLIPDVATEYWYHGTKIDHILKRSRRHHYLLARIDPGVVDREVVYDLKVEDVTELEGEECRLIAREKMKYDVQFERWVWDKDGSYRILLNLEADPRLNGCAVVTHDQPPRLIGMAIAPVGFKEKMQCVPIDLIESTSPCYEYVMPTVCITTVGGVNCHHAYGNFVGPESFRAYDVRAERGQDTVIETESGGALRVTGSLGTGLFSPLRYDPVLEVGQFVFGVGLSGKVICVAEIVTTAMRRKAKHMVSTIFSSKIILSLGGQKITDFKSLIHACQAIVSDPDVIPTVRWADGRIEEILQPTRKKNGGMSYGVAVSNIATLWYGTLAPYVVAPPKEEEEEEAKDWDDDDGGDSCIDECDGFLRGTKQEEEEGEGKEKPQPLIITAAEEKKEGEDEEKGNGEPSIDDPVRSGHGVPDEHSGHSGSQ
jgi:hypothetical protein